MTIELTDLSVLELGLRSRNCYPLDPALDYSAELSSTACYLVILRRSTALRP